MLRVLGAAQRIGLLGPRPVTEVAAHARAFVRALLDPPRSSCAAVRSSGPSTLVDIGSGGGVPGLVIATELPSLTVTLVDRRQRCTDFLERAVRTLRLSERVTVRCADTKSLIATGRRYDAVTARGFGPPASTLATARALINPGGSIVLGEPPHERWPVDQLERLGLAYRRCGAVGIFVERST